MQHACSNVNTKIVFCLFLIICRFNGQAREGTQALDDIHNRASYELFADVLLVKY